VFQEAFASAFDRAARVYLAPVYFKENDPIPIGERLDTAALARAIGSRGPAAFACASNEEILERVLADAGGGDIALFMSNGPFDDLKNRMLTALRERG
jgi:UDP-N-acetylmuramate: L-alanyl-gamma-D-glutamyl-meso-diaminopimelate ligase